MDVGRSLNITLQNLKKVLEWERFIQLAKSEAITEPGKNLLSQLEEAAHWASETSVAHQMQQETSEITPLLDRDALWAPLAHLSDPEIILDQLSRGGVLAIEDLGLLRRWLYAVDSWIQIPRDEIRGERFKKTLHVLQDPLSLLRILDSVLTPEGELSEKASPRLASLYSEIRLIKREIHQILDQLVRDLSQKGILQENYIDVRDGRYVLPIKISFQNEIEGIIYEASASHQTVFIEPKEVGTLNNRLRKKQNDLAQEIFQILQAVSRQLQPFVTEITNSIHTLVHWDAVQAKARLGRHYSGKPIQVTEERLFFLKQTAHPLLWWSLPAESIIRNDIDFSHPIKTLLLTGPNTGGKTVLLKTLGLAGICAKTGFPFPATDHPVVPFFDSFFADLGDPQSIEHHLSSFSGHVLRFKEILELLTDRSLILIDELNSATDPEEGAAFGRAVLETLMQREAMLVTTTHDPHLKALAISDSRILNASMAFDENSRMPTFQMLQGVPGRSRALETAQRLGIPDEVIQLAKSYLSSEHIEFERLLTRLETDVHEASRAHKEAIALHEEAERLKKEWLNKTETHVHELLERTRQKLRRILEQAQDEVRSTVRKLDEMKSRREVDQSRARLNETFREATVQLEAALQEEAPSVAKALAEKEDTFKTIQKSSAIPLEPGTQVRIPKWKNTGSVISIQGNKVKVAMGTLQVTLSTNEIEPLAPSAGKPHPSSKVKLTTVTSPSPPPAEIDLRGTRLDEAMSMLEKYLDQAFRSGELAEVTIIHGLGTGALREGTLKLLRELPYIKSSRNGGPGHGGSGATIVEFDKA